MSTLQYVIQVGLQNMWEVTSSLSLLVEGLAPLLPEGERGSSVSKEEWPPKINERMNNQIKSQSLQHSKCNVWFQVTDEDLWQTHSTLQSAINGAHEGDVIILLPGQHTLCQLGYLFAKCGALVGKFFPRQAYNLLVHPSMAQ